MLVKDLNCLFTPQMESIVEGKIVIDDSNYVSLILQTENYKIYDKGLEVEGLIPCPELMLMTKLLDSLFQIEKSQLRINSDIFETVLNSAKAELGETLSSSVGILK